MKKRLITLNPCYTKSILIQAELMRALYVSLDLKVEDSYRHQEYAKIEYRAIMYKILFHEFLLLSLRSLHYD